MCIFLISYIKTRNSSIIRTNLDLYGLKRYGYYQTRVKEINNPLPTLIDKLLDKSNIFLIWFGSSLDLSDFEQF